MTELNNLLAQVREANTAMMRHHHNGEHGNPEKCLNALKPVARVLILLAENGFTMDDLISLATETEYLITHADEMLPIVALVLRGE